MITDLITRTSDFIWNYPLLILLVGTGLYFTIRLRFIQIRRFQYPLLLEKRTEINNKLGKLYKAVLLDMEARDE